MEVEVWVPVRWEWEVELKSSSLVDMLHNVDGSISIGGEVRLGTVRSFDEGR